MPIGPNDQEEVDRARSLRVETRRATVPALEEVLYSAVPVLDHGFIRVVDYMGDDGAVVQAARVSYGTGTRRTSDDRTLIRYLMRHSHTTPFEMAEIKLHVRLPIFVARQWIRHRTASVNEYSARYSVLDREFYVPSPENLARQASDNRQGRAEPLAADEADKVIRVMKSDAERSYQNYLWMLNDEDEPSRPGLARELARINLPLSTYTQWYWKTNLHNFMHFVQLRSDAHAQYEIRAYAEEMLKIMMRWVPITCEAFLEYHLHAVKLSSSAVAVVKGLLQGADVAEALARLSRRERADLCQTFGIADPAAHKPPSR